MSATFGLSKWYHHEGQKQRVVWPPRGHSAAPQCATGPVSPLSLHSHSPAFGTVGACWWGGWRWAIWPTSFLAQWCAGHQPLPLLLGEAPGSTGCMTKQASKLVGGSVLLSRAAGLPIRLVLLMREEATLPHLAMGVAQSWGIHRPPTRLGIFNAKAGPAFGWNSWAFKLQKICFPPFHPQTVIQLWVECVFLFIFCSTGIETLKAILQHSI